jgi:hypothetical protein
MLLCNGEKGGGWYDWLLSLHEKRRDRANACTLHAANDGQTENQNNTQSHDGRSGWPYAFRTNRLGEEFRPFFCNNFIEFEAAIAHF